MRLRESVKWSLRQFAHVTSLTLFRKQQQRTSPATSALFNGLTRLLYSMLYALCILRYM